MILLVLQWWYLFTSCQWHDALFRLEFESQRTQLYAQLEYEQNQLEEQKKKLHKMEETIDKEERTVAEYRRVVI